MSVGLRIAVLAAIAFFPSIGQEGQTTAAATETVLGRAEVPGLAAFSWAGDDRLIVFTRRQYGSRFRRFDPQIVQVSRDFRLEYLSPPRDLFRLSVLGDNPASAVSPDGRWLLGTERAGTRMIDLTNGESQLWGADARAGFWLPDSSGRIELSFPVTHSDPGRQAALERELDSRVVDLRLFERFGDEWPDQPSRVTRIAIPAEAVVIGIIGPAELALASRPLPADRDVVLSSAGIGKDRRSWRPVTLVCPTGGELSALALSPDRRSVAYLTSRLRESGRDKTLGYFEQEFIRTLELWVAPLEQGPPRRILTIDVAPGDTEVFSNRGRTTALSWRPDGRVIAFAANEQVVFARVEPSR